MTRDSIDYFLRIKKEDIYLLCPYFEAFQGMAAIRTPKPEAGDEATLHLMVSPDFTAEFDQVIANLQKRLKIERIDG
ncbi:hypothetical protein A3K48_06530 [candidate division WOR-1 bacterium RIFOXYA12_FULL_52_29]|uniref:DUF4911 domain-containing protein n=1 Tax=candidate division WOR-1 bacterium RIFOXYC12_FULL_54_18 TaxID=1802584 RepID=A0A1F4T7I6_UNCSA|nr:MAG: hypothetical protein A3K44_06530 [candidate division WOR-1 bacterium RIFOXYA2_FULL_51_19]OGC18179.1 MAG: hypothetical protein A3K48_06530 [candidate division WOR-1 bacterium RIFOXYA12_FULL_52_29]OGC27034.1 MAG: hypothetical protein A3K32_06525 [candidate division WOR-1 bacterium RIFOXYB2_FULL_45_9]OGC28596.1 MAG: hypothetical protein A3K49_06530 [candidate division WOR-1 bacterium RIFOXYC12_FULL_54_18]OGC30949.1 MAG: hypothetical protein A2346_06090 [candidate division WOR-1 bacterium R